MKIVISGSRQITSAGLLDKAIEDSGFIITEVISGHCRGVDMMGEDWAKKHGIPITLFSANWAKYGKAAGPIRNEEMANYAEALICLWDGKSKGTKSMIDIAKAKGLKIYIHGVSSS